MASSSEMTLNLQKLLLRLFALGDVGKFGAHLVSNTAIASTEIKEVTPPWQAFPAARRCENFMLHPIGLDGAWLCPPRRP
jgi:hypothetical protein